MNYKIIVNPTSGKGMGAQAVPLIREALDAQGLHYDLVCTERPWHAAELAQEAAKSGYDVVVAAGGDGTLNEVLNGLILAKQAGVDGVALGALSVGRGNDFAYGGGIPHELTEGVRVLAQGQRRTIDVGRVEGGFYPQGRYFGNGVGIGFDAVVGFEAAKLKHVHGFLSYMIAAIKTIFLYAKAPVLRIEYDGKTLVQPTLMVSVMNGRRMGGSFMMAPHSWLNDGLFDLCIAHQVSQVRIIKLISAIMKGTQESLPDITTGRTQRIVVTAVEGSLPAHADGETLCTEGQQLVMEVVAAQLDLITESTEFKA
mgnify:CR=1 FL=1